MYYYRTRVGLFLIVPRGHRWHVMFNDDSLGIYAHPHQAAEDLAGGHTFSAGPGIDTAELGIPYDLSDWSKGKP